MKKKLLWVGQVLTESGYARISENVLPYLAKDYDVSVLGIGYDGDPYTDRPYRIWRADRFGDPWGVNRIHQVMVQERPDITCIVMEPWNLMAFIQEIRRTMKNAVRVCSYCVVDGENMKPAHAEWLAQYDITAFATAFGMNVAKAAGFNGYWYLLPHGLNPTMYQPVDRQRARRMIGLRNVLDEHAFIIGNVNENAPRKRMDLTIAAWAGWWKAAGKPRNAYLYLHCSKNSPVGWDIGQLAKHHGIKGRVVAPADDIRYGEHQMKYVYNAMDLQFTTSVGEGWGFTTMEGMACGVPQIVPNHSALSEWPDGGALVVGKGRPVYAAQQQNVLQYEPDMNELAAQLTLLAQDYRLRDQLGRAGRALVLRDEFRWSHIAAGFNAMFEQAMEGPRVEKEFITEPVLSGPSGTGTR
jgi:D-inositol-3-phosphate glycosyltransferase